MVPSNFGCGVTVLAAIATHAPSYAALIAIANPIPLDAPEMKITFPFKSPSFLKLKVFTCFKTQAFLAG